ncbi:glycosyltransferase family 4 protein [Flavobacterium lindanitolerans]|jgi:glycosyltransferase involved in cell wall biosynthesis|uniref:glycosyltransferase family 4 protein n=1 Tax=Flavobacterium lindanitolerans TaxID=428988 RepID=UPI0023F0534D|nr:glycosyltransferase family 4 protein [Flavobacterium lindanitolerans]
MHIAFLTPEYPHEKVLHAAGIGTSIKNLVLALHKEKIKVSVFVYSQKTDEILEEDGIKIHLIQHKKYKAFGWYFYRKHLQNYLNRYITKDKIDLVEAPDWTGITAFMNLNASLVIRFHGSDAYFCRLENRKQKRKNFWFEKLGLEKAKAYIAPTQFAGNLTKEIFKIKGKFIQTLHYGIQLSDFSNETPEDFEPGLILYIGTIIRKKGVLELPAILEKVVAKNPEAHLLLIGSDSYDLQTQSSSTWQLLHSMLNETLKEKVSYLGRVPYNEIREHIQKANVCVFPTFAETLGMVTIECMAMQKAVVNSNIGWAKELIVDGESGFLVHPKDHTVYAEKINELITDKNQVLQLGKNARTRVEHVFDIRKTVLQNIEFYKQQL